MELYDVLLRPEECVHQADNTVSIRCHAQSLLEAFCNEANLLAPLQEQFLLVFKHNLMPRP